MGSTPLRGLANCRAYRGGERASLPLALLVRHAGRGRDRLFDRSWYGRVLVERVEGFVREKEWRRAYDEINEFESLQHENGTTLVKVFLHITQEEQDRRLEARLEHPWKRWKLNAEDFRNRARRRDYLRAMHEMFERTNTHAGPWQVINGNDKRAARIAALTYIADRLSEACRWRRRRFPLHSPRWPAASSGWTSSSTTSPSRRARARAPRPPVLRGPNGIGEAVSTAELRREHDRNLVAPSASSARGFVRNAVTGRPVA